MASISISSKESFINDKRVIFSGPLKTPIKEART